jgi:predicted RNA binding protein YcfA (HicA-like mRNA interferase family)
VSIVSSVAVDGYGRVHAEEDKNVRKALIEAGWRVVRQAGSHEVWAHVDYEARIVVAGKDRDTVPVGTLGSIRRASGLEHLR